MLQMGACAKVALHTGAAPRCTIFGVIWAFADAIARVAGRKHLSTGHHGDVTITDNSKGSAMLGALVATMRWAMTMAWLGAAPPGTKPPIVKPEGILGIVKRGR